MPAHKPRFRLSPTLLAMLASGILLSGCDLWGGSDTQATTSSVGADTPVVIAQMDSVSTADGSYLFSTSGRTEDGVYQQLHIVDPATGLELDGYPLFVDADSGQIASQAFTTSTDGLSQKDGNNVELFLVRDHKLYKVSLLRPQAPIPAQVSSEENVCSLLKVIPKDSNAASSWVMLRATRDASGDCGDSEQVVTKMVLSDADTDKAATNVDQISQVLTVQRDPATGTLLAVFGLAPAKIAATSTTGTTTDETDDRGTLTTVTQKFVSMDGPTGTVTEITLTPDASLHVTYFGRVAGSTTKAYMRVTNGSTINGLYVVDGASVTPSLPTSAAANLVANDSVFVHADSSANYYVDGASLVSLTPGGLRTVLNTWSQSAPQAGGVMTSSYLVVPQVDANGNISLQAFSKTKTNSARNIVLSQTGTPVTIVAHNGDVLIVSEAAGTSSTLWRVDLNTSAIGTKLSEQATLVSITPTANETLAGEQQQAYVIWSTAINDSTLSLNSHQLSSAQSYVLSSSVPTWDLALTSPLTISQGLLTSTTGPDDTLWQFDAGKANSLLLVPQPE